MMSKFKKIIIVTLLSSVFIGGYSARAEAPDWKDAEPQIATLQGKEYYLSLVERYAQEYGVSSTKMKKTIDCENRSWDPKLQSLIINSRGEREKSYGLAQIHLPSNPHVSLEQATDPEFSIKFMAEKFSKGRYSMWTCARKLGY